MKILLQTTDNDFLFLAGDGRIPERVFSSVADFELSGELEKQIVRKVRGSHARAISRGNVSHRAFFRTRRLFSTAQEAEDYAVAAERSFPRAGTLYFITGSGTRKLLDALITPPITTVQGGEVRLQYQASGANFTPSEPELVLDGASGVLYRVVEDTGEKWFEVGFDSPTLLDGNAADGWTDATANLLLRFQRSETLTAWDYEWIPCPTSPETITGGYRYWARSPFPVDSAVKSAAITCESTDVNGDTRNNPLTSVVIASVTQSLPNFPYTLPGHAAQLQTDMRAAGWTGTLVTASSDTVWSISIPTVNYTAYSQSSYVGWPGYLVEDIFGDLTNTVDQRGFTGNFINAVGVRTGVPKQFARMTISPGPNYRY